MLREGFIHEFGKYFEPKTVVNIVAVPNVVSVADSTEKYIIQTTHGEYFLLASSELSPLLIRRGTDRQRQALANLHGSAAEAIELPFAEGFDGTKSFAIWRRGTPLSKNRIKRHIEKLVLYPRIYQWLRDVATQTVSAIDPEKLAENARRLQDISTLPDDIKIAAGKACFSFLHKKTPARQVFQHGDFWIGNVLRSRSKIGFIVIDWPGAMLEGAPFFDLTKFALSVGSSRARLRNEVRLHSNIIGCHPSDALNYVLSGLGALHRSLEHFPLEEFVKLCVQKTEILKSL